MACSASVCLEFHFSSVYRLEFYFSRSYPFAASPPQPPCYSFQPLSALNTVHVPVITLNHEALQQGIPTSYKA